MVVVVVVVVVCTCVCMYQHACTMVYNWFFTIHLVSRHTLFLLFLAVLYTRLLGVRFQVILLPLPPSI